MDSINLIATFYKQELADANEQTILYKAQCELYKQEIEQLREQLKQANEKILDLEAEDKMEAEVVQLKDDVTEQ